MGLSDLAFDSVEDLWNFQLEGTGVSIADFNATGMVPLADSLIYKDMETFKFKTPSGKIELVSDRLESNGLVSLKPYESPQSPPDGQIPSDLRPVHPPYPGAYREQSGPV